MAARRRPARRIALALMASLAVHGAVLLTVMVERGPTPGQPGVWLDQPVLIDLQRSRSAAPSQPPHPAAAAQAPARPATGAVAPSPLTAAPAPGPTAPGVGPPSASPGPIAQGPGAGPPASGAGPALKFDCPPGAELNRTGAVRANPCAFRGAPRDRLPERVVRQASIDADKAEYYDRVLDSRVQMRDNFAYGNLPFATCRIQFGGGKGAASAHPHNTLKLGKLPCYLIPPHGSLDPDVFVEPPPPKHPAQPGDMAQ